MTTEKENQVKQDLATAVTELGERLAKYDDDIKSNAEISDKFREELKAVEGRVSKLHDTLVEMQKERGRLDTDQPTPDVTIGQILVSHDQYKEYKPGARKDSGNIPIPGGFLPHRQKDLTSTTGGDGIINYRDPRIVDLLFQPLTLRDLIPTFPVGVDAVDYIKESRFNQLMAQLVATANSGQADILVDNICGFYAGQTVTLDEGGADDEDLVISSIVQTGTDADVNSYAGTITFTTNLTNTQALGTIATSDTFMFTPETKLKPRADYEVEKETVNVKTLAHFMAATRQILADAPQLRRQVDMHLMFGLGRMEEQQFLYGDGTANQLQGIMTDTDTLDYSWSSGTVGDTKLDAIRRAMTLSMLAHIPPTAVVVHPSDWEDIETAKGNDGHYIWAAVPGGGANPMVWRLPVVVTTVIDSGDALVGAFELGCTIYDREESNIRLSEHHKDYFQKNMVAILAEERLAFAINRPEAFVAVDFDAAP